MTAEIAIINRNAVTLATDSAVTLTVRGAEKIYNAADKLFELCELDPIGVMTLSSETSGQLSIGRSVVRFKGKANWWTARPC